MAIVAVIVVVIEAVEMILNQKKRSKNKEKKKKRAYRQLLLWFNVQCLTSTQDHELWSIQGTRKKDIQEEYSN